MHQKFEVDSSLFASYRKNNQKFITQKSNYTFSNSRSISPYFKLTHPIVEENKDNKVRLYASLPLCQPINYLSIIKKYHHRQIGIIHKQAKHHQNFIMWNSFFLFGDLKMICLVTEKIFLVGKLLKVNGRNIEIQISLLGIQCTRTRVIIGNYLQSKHKWRIVEMPGSAFLMKATKP